MAKNIRDYGMFDSTKYIVGPPRLKQMLTELDGVKHVCPNCKMETVAEIEVTLQGVPMLRTEWGVGTYLSCPACPWAAPIIITATETQP